MLKDEILKLRKEIENKICHVLGANNLCIKCEGDLCTSCVQYVFKVLSNIEDPCSTRLMDVYENIYNQEINDIERAITTMKNVTFKGDL